MCLLDVAYSQQCLTAGFHFGGTESLINSRIYHIIVTVALFVVIAGISDITNSLKGFTFAIMAALQG